MKNVKVPKQITEVKNGRKRVQGNTPTVRRHTPKNRQTSSGPAVTGKATNSSEPDASRNVVAIDLGLATIGELHTESRIEDAPEVGCGGSVREFVSRHGDIEKRIEELKGNDTMSIPIPGGENLNPEKILAMGAPSKLEELKQDAANEDTADTFMQPAKKRGRRKGGKNRPKTDIADDGTELPPVVNPEEFKPILKPVVGIISNYGVRVAETPSAALTAEESEAIIDAAAQCVAKYLPNALSEHACAVVLLLCLGQYGMRVYNLRQVRLAELRAEFAAKQGVKVVGH